jgi:hypothetical protein
LIDNPRTEALTAINGKNETRHGQNEIEELRNQLRGIQSPRLFGALKHQVIGFTNK